MFSYKFKLKLLKIVQIFFKIFNLKIYYSKDKNVLKNININTIVDVGVAKGTGFLFNNFPNSRYLLIEPNKDYFEFIEKNILNKYNAKLFKIGAGKTEESKILNISGPISSIYKRKNFEFKNQYEIKVKKLDDILTNEDLKKNLLVKIDCEGAELDVLEGSLKTLCIANYLIIEVRLQKINTYNPTDLICFLKNQNFQWYEILDIYYAKEGIDYIDVLFKKIK